MKFFKFFQYAYLAFAALFLYGAFSNWNEDRNRSYMLLLFGVLAIFMFFFKKKFNKRFEEGKRPQK